MIFSLIVPLYNSDYIEKQLKSIYSVKLSSKIKIDVFFIDDGSSKIFVEKYITFINVFKKKNNFINLNYLSIWNKNWKNRICKARNIWVKKSKSSNLIFIDQDTILHKNYLQDLLPNIKWNKIILWPYLWYNNLRKKLNNSDVNFFINNWFIKKNNFEDFRLQGYINKQRNNRLWELFCWSNFFIKKDTFLSIWWFDESITMWWDEDVEFAYRLFEKWYKIIFNKNFIVLNISKKLYNPPYTFLDKSDVESLTENLYKNYLKHNNWDYKNYILNRFNNLPLSYQKETCEYFKKNLLTGKKNILIHAINGIWLWHINRTLCLANSFKNKDYIWNIIFITNSKNPFLIESQNFVVETLEYWIEDTIKEINFLDYENKNFEKISEVLEKYRINTIIHDTYFIKPLVSKYLNLKHFLILRDSELVYLSWIKHLFSLFKKIYIPHTKDELSKDKFEIFKNLKNISYINYITHNDNLFLNKQKKIIISPWYGWDYLETLKFFQYINKLLFQNIEILENYKIKLILWKHFIKIRLNTSFPKSIQIVKFVDNLDREISTCEIFIWRWWYNTVNEVIKNRCKAILYPVSRYAENQEKRIKFFINHFSLDTLKIWKYKIWNDSRNLEYFIKNNKDFIFYPNSKVNSGFIFDWVHNFLNDFEKEILKENILIFKNIFLPISENFIFNEIESFKEFNPIVVTLKKENTNIFSSNFQIFYKSEFEKLLNSDYPKIYSQDLYIDFLKYITYILKKYEINIIYTEFLFDAYFLIKLKNIIPDVKIISAWRWYDVYVFLKNIYLKPEIFLNKLDKILLRDKKMLDHIISLWIKDEKIEIIRSFIKLPLYSFKLKNYKKLDVLIWWRFVDKKWILELLDLIFLLNGEKFIWKIWLVWDGELKSHIFIKIKNLWLQDKIKYFGFLGHKDFICKLNEYNCFINYSKISINLDDEGISNILVENILSWNVVFTTIVWGIWDIVNDKKTWIVLSWTPKEDYKKIKNVYTNNDLEIIVKHWKKKVKELYNKRNSICKLENIIKDYA